MNVADPVTLPSELPYASRASAWNDCDAPAPIVADAGVRARWSSVPGTTSSENVPVLPASVAVTVWGPATVAVQVAPEHEPSGEIENVAAAVTSPVELS